MLKVWLVPVLVCCAMYLIGIVCGHWWASRVLEPVKTEPPPKPKQYLLVVITKTAVRKIVAETISYNVKGDLELLIDNKICAIFSAGHWQSIEVEEIPKVVEQKKEQEDEPTAQGSL